MDTKLFPQIRALRALEAAARTGSFTLAAKELNLTQAAISYQIRQLETDLGLALFVRHHNNLKLTEAAIQYLPFVRSALRALSDGSDVLKTGNFDGTLRVSVSQSLATRWLVRRVSEFSAAYPEFDIRIEASDELTDFDTENIDLAIRYARSVDPGLHATLLSTDQVFPVCSPSILESHGRIRTPRDLARHALLHDVMTDVTWRQWFGASGTDFPNPDNGPVFSHSSLTVDAAVAGKGVALGRSLLVADELAENRLIRPFDLAVSSSYAYYIVHPTSKTNEPKIAAIRDWLLSEARASERVLLRIPRD